MVESRNQKIYIFSFPFSNFYYQFPVSSYQFLVFGRRSKVKKFFKINHQIAAKEVRVIGEDGKQIGILTLSEALQKAKGAQLDLVEIAPDAKPPVVKIIGFKKFKYLEEKKEKEARRHTKQTELKEVRFSPFIGEHDLLTAIEKVKRFFAEGNLVKISIIFTGRQMAHQEFGPKLLQKIMTYLPDAQVEKTGRFEGRRFVAVIKCVKVSKSQGIKVENQNIDASTH
ncbi:translation initiation factor IF-3 [Candidatus Curtissbacteria bacterium]|nr:translation initiation factor IF-3 [Candidatus Curtissbacteria bacterium]